MKSKIEKKPVPVTKTKAQAPAKVAAAAPAKGKANVTREQQTQYDVVISAARKSLYGEAQDDTRFKMLLERLSGAKEEIANAIGSVTAVVMTNIAGTAKKQGRQIPAPILFHAGREVIADLVEIAVAAKFLEQARAAEVTKEAMLEWVRIFKEGGAPGAEATSSPSAPKPPGPPAQAAAPPPAAGAPNFNGAPVGIINNARAMV